MLCLASSVCTQVSGSSDEVFDQSDRYRLVMGGIAVGVEGSGTAWESVFNLGNCAIGAGILSFPYAFWLAGACFFLSLSAELLLIPASPSV